MILKSYQLVWLLSSLILKFLIVCELQSTIVQSSSDPSERDTNVSIDADIQKRKKKWGTCRNFDQIDCYSKNSCPGFCGDKAINAGDDCTNNKQCKKGPCMRDECVFPSKVCEHNKSKTCKNKNDCRVCSESSLNAGSDCTRHKECKKGKCTFKNKCTFPSGFCAGDGNEVCKTKHDCPGSCSEQSKSKGKSCDKNHKCSGKGGVCIWERCIIGKKTSAPSGAPSFLDSPTAYPSKITDIPTDSPFLSTTDPTAPPTSFLDSPTAYPSKITDIPTDSPFLSTTDPTAPPTPNPPTPVPSNEPTPPPTLSPSTSPSPISLEEALLSDKLFGPSGNTCSNYIPENGEYSFTFDLSSLPYFDDTLSDVEEVMFQVQMSHTDSTNSNRTWAIKVGTGGHIYSFQGPYGESIPPNTKSGMLFVDEVNQKVCVDSVKNRANDELYFIHQAGVYQNGDPGYTDTVPVWFSPNVAIYCSLTIPECRMASWGQQSFPRAWTERVIYYDRYRDCGDGILERTHIIHNAELESTDTVLTFTNMPWGGTRYSTLKDFVLSQNPDTWNYDQYELPGGVEDPMLIFALDDQYGADVNRQITSTWTLGYTIFAEDLPFVEYPSTPPFTFPGRLPAEGGTLSLVADYGEANTNWICQGPLNGFMYPDTGNYRCRFADFDVALTKGCNQCYLRLTNSDGESFAVFNVRHWLIWDASQQVYLMYFNSHETSSTIKNVITSGTTITVSWDETGKSPEDNLALSFVHGTSEQMVGDNYSPSKIRYGHANNVQRDFAVFEYISYPNLSFGDSYRARQYYITDQYTGLSDRSKALAADTIEEVIQSGQFEMSQIHLHHINDGQSTTFGITIDDSPCNNIQTTALACTGSSTPQIGKNAFLQMDCGASTYVGTDFYHFSNFPTTPYRVMNCIIDGETTSTRPSVKLLGYFSDVDCGTTLQDKTFDPDFCSN